MVGGREELEGWQGTVNKGRTGDREKPEGWQGTVRNGRDGRGL